MDNAIYVSLSRQMVLQRSIEISANNVANMDTAGFKVEHLAVHAAPLTPTGTGGRFGPVTYVNDTGVVRNFSQGSLEKTGNPLDLAINGNGFFSIQTANGPAYTRDGHFTIDAQNQIVDKQGNPVLSASGSPITIDPTRAAPTIGKDGVVSQVGPNAQVAQLGKIGVVRFANLGSLSKAGGNLFTDGSGQTPAPATDVTVSQGMIEKSNVSGVAEVANLISVQRAYERMQDIISATQTMSGKAIDSLGKLSS
jgi:flagellar basal-body rod protein FlgF